MNFKPIDPLFYLEPKDSNVFIKIINIVKT